MKWSVYDELSAGNIADDDDFLTRDKSDTSLAATGTQKRYLWLSIKATIKSFLGWTGDDLAISGEVSVSSKIVENVNAHGLIDSTGIEVFDLDDGSYHTVTVGADFTVSFDNWPVSGKLSSVTIKLINPGAHTITWPAAVDWPAGTEPSWTAAGTDFAVFYSDDGGTIIYGIQSVIDIK